MSAIMCRGGCAAFRRELVTELTQLLDASEYPTRPICAHNGKLYGVFWGRLYEWDDSGSWTLRVLMNTPGVGSLCSFNGDLYASMNQSHPHISNISLAKWNGVDVWIAVAPPITGLTDVTSLCEHNGKLYGIAYDVNIGNSALVEWNGSDAWVIVAPKLLDGQYFYMTSICSYNGKIYGGACGNPLLGYYRANLLEWNGSDAWEIVAVGDENISISNLCVLNNKLYATSYDFYNNYGGELLQWNNNVWIKVADGIHPHYNYTLQIGSVVVYNGKIFACTNGTIGDNYSVLMSWNGTDAWNTPVLHASGQTLSITTVKESLYASGYSVYKYTDGLVSKRIPSASYLTISAPTYQSWTTYPDSPVLTASYPYQVIFSAASYIRLIVSTAPWYYLYNGETQLKSAAVGKMYQLIGGVWEYLSDADNYSYTTLLQANADVYDNATLSNVYFAKTTAGGVGSKRVHGAFYKKINSGVDRRQQWENFPDSPVKTEDYPYQLLFKSGRLYVSKGSLYVSNYVSRLNCTAETQLYTLTDSIWILTWTFTPSDNWILYFTGIGGNDVLANQSVFYEDLITVWKAKDTTPDQDAGIWTENRRIAL